MVPASNLLREPALRVAKNLGIFKLFKNSSWRQHRLLIVCYHGVALEDEHEWRPNLFVSRAHLEKRFELLHEGGYSVVSLGEGIEKMYKDELPPRSIVLTFDDGTYDFYHHSYPTLRSYGYPATVYLTTYYSGRPYPVFPLACSYMLWKRRDLRDISLFRLKIDDRFDLTTEDSRERVVSELVTRSDRDGLNGEEKNEVAAKLAHIIGLDYEALCAKRILQLMQPAEVGELARSGVDFQLHTHRHRTPMEETLFRREIEDNRNAIRQSASAEIVHFCYPSGAYRPEFLPWLSAEGVVSATTCDTGLASARSNALLLPRLVDTSGRSQLVFESWVAGAGQFLSLRKRARLAYDTRGKQKHASAAV